MRSLLTSLLKLRPGKTGESAKAEPNFRLMAEHSSDIVIEVGADRRTAYVSPSCTRLLGWRPEELIGRGPEAFVLPEYLAAIQSDIAAFESGQCDEGTLVMQLRKKEGGTLWVEGKARIVREGGGGGELIAVLRDISDRKKAEEQLLMAALTDGLTGLFNRRAFDDRLERDWTGTVGSGGRMSLLLIDIDRFKLFNDTYGHQAGDDCLRVVALAARGALQHLDGMVARYGGEEFAAILPGLDLPHAMDFAEGVRRAVWAAEIPHLLNKDGAGRVTVSIGVATALSRAGGTIRMPEGLLLAADGALYKAKHNGRNRAEAALLLAPEGSTAAA